MNARFINLELGVFLHQSLVGYHVKDLKLIGYFRWSSSPNLSLGSVSKHRVKCTLDDGPKPEPNSKSRFGGKTIDYEIYNF